MTPPIESPEPESVQKLRIDNRRLSGDLDYYREQYAWAETLLTGISSLTDGWRRINVQGAVDQLEALLEGEAGPVDEVIRHVLTAILHDLGVGGVIERQGPPRGRWVEGGDDQ